MRRCNGSATLWRHANAFPTKTSQFRMALQHHERNSATRSAHTLEAILSHDTANHPAHQGHAAFTPACFALFPHTVCPHTRSNHITRCRQSSCLPATRRVYTSMFRASQWQGATQTHFPPRPRKSARRSDIANVIRHTACPHTRSNPITRYSQSSSAPQWHGASQTHFPPRPRKSAWRCDITDVFSPHGLPTHYKQSYHTMPPIIPLTSDRPRLRQHVSPVARRHANALPTKTSQSRMALRHHERNVCPHTRSNHITLDASASESSSATLFPVLHLYYKLATSESSSERLFPALHLHYKLATSESSSKCICTTNWPGLSPAPKSSFPHYICTTNWPLLSPAPKSSFPHCICTTNWPLSPAPQVKRQVSKTNVSYETSSKSEAPSLQNERFVRDFLQK